MLFDSECSRPGRWTASLDSHVRTTDPQALKKLGDGKINIVSRSHDEVCAAHPIAQQVMSLPGALCFKRCPSPARLPPSPDRRVEPFDRLEPFLTDSEPPRRQLETLLTSRRCADQEKWMVSLMPDNSSPKFFLYSRSTKSAQLLFLA
eukprot:3251732-Rhodomonas_salina.1